MSSVKFFIVGVVSLCVTWHVDAKEMSRVTCHDVPLNTSTAKMTEIDTVCYAQMKEKDPSLPAQPAAPGTKDAKKIWKHPCFKACVLEVLGVLTPTGAFSPNATAYVNAVYPASAAPAIISGVKACATSNPALSKDDNCSTYKPFSKCYKEVLRTVCKAKPTAARRRRAAGDPTTTPSSSSEEED